jgi:hypothetical protein
MPLRHCVEGFEEGVKGIKAVEVRAREVEAVPSRFVSVKPSRAPRRGAGRREMRPC